MRLQKYMAHSGAASRRKSEELIELGRVRVNDQIVTELGYKVDPEKDRVYLDDRRLKLIKKHTYIALNKPLGVVSTVKDEKGRDAVVDLIEEDIRLYPVGRLDIDTTGLLILTDDGAVTNKLIHPRYNIEKTYIAKLFGRPDDKNIQEFRRGIMIDTGMTQPAKLEILEDLGKYCVCKITITEGKNRQVRKMCDAIKHPVATLQRVGTGEIELGDLKKGAYRYLTEKEIKYLKSL